MTLPKFTTLHSCAVPLAVENIDTDQIIPARFLKAIERKGFGKNLFRDWRYTSENTLDETCPLNDPKYSGSILIAAKNFGCGSSREHAAWALYDAGFRVVVSSFFADIFRNNALNNGLLPIQISTQFLQKSFEILATEPQITWEINLLEQRFGIPSRNLFEQFEIDAYKKECLLNGYDDIDFLLSIQDQITSFENHHTMPGIILPSGD